MPTEKQRHKTIAESGEPLSDDEKRELAESWFGRTLAALLAYADHNQPSAEEMCREVVGHFGPDDKLSGLLQKGLRAERAGKERARPKKWTPARYYALLLHYEFLLSFGLERSEALSELAKMEGLKEVHEGNALEKIKKRITKARKQIDINEIRLIVKAPRCTTRGPVAGGMAVHDAPGPTQTTTTEEDST